MRLELVNDGSGGRRNGGSGGSGLRSLADRLTAANGRAAAQALDGGQFRLQVEVPA